MKKLLALLLAALISISMVACGESNKPAGEETSNTDNETPESTTFAIGEAFGTDSVECVIKEIKWITSEDFEQYTTRETLSISTLFPDYEAKGTTKITKSSLTDSSYLCVVYSLQNVGKEDVVSGEESVGDGSYWALPYGTIEVNYDDGYTFSAGSDGFTKYFGFTNTLKVLSDPITEVMIYELPNQVFENDDKPLNLKVTLPSSNEETEEFIVSIR